MNQLSTEAALEQRSFMVYVERDDRHDNNDNNDNDDNDDAGGNVSHLATESTLTGSTAPSSKWRLTISLRIKRNENLNVMIIFMKGR